MKRPKTVEEVVGVRRYWEGRRDGLLEALREVLYHVGYGDLYENIKEEYGDAEKDLASLEDPATISESQQETDN